MICVLINSKIFTEKCSLFLHGTKVSFLLVNIYHCEDSLDAGAAAWLLHLCLVVESPGYVWPVQQLVQLVIREHLPTTIFKIKKCKDKERVEYIFKIYIGRLSFLSSNLASYLSCVLVVGNDWSNVVFAVQKIQQLLGRYGLQRRLDVLSSCLELAPDKTWSVKWRMIQWY